MKVRDMPKDIRIWFSAGAILVATYLIGSQFYGKPRPDFRIEDLPQIRYVCKKSGEVFTLPLMGDVHENPKTGEPTLVPAVYDKRRKKWRPGPPLEMMHRQGLLKPAG